jgi:putative transposase
MARNYYSELNLHIVWHTKNGLPLLTPDVDQLACRTLRKMIIDTDDAFLHAIGGIETHLHLAVTVPPTLEISRWIGRLKGKSAYEVNHRLGDPRNILQWQTGYGVVSFGSRDLRWVVEYIGNQRLHHQRGSLHDRLERTVRADDPITVRATKEGP